MFFIADIGRGGRGGDGDGVLYRPDANGNSIFQRVRYN